MLAPSVILGRSVGSLIRGGLDKIAKNKRETGRIFRGRFRGNSKNKGVGGSVFSTSPKTKTETFKGTEIYKDNKWSIKPIHMGLLIALVYVLKPKFTKKWR